MVKSKKVRLVKEKQKRISKSNRAGLQFSVARIHHNLRKGKYADRIGAGAPVYLSAVLEYLTSEILELAGNMAMDSYDNRITPYYINMSVRMDPDIQKMFYDVTIPQGGVLPGVHPVLLYPKKQMMTYFTTTNNSWPFLPN